MTESKRCPAGLTQWHCGDNCEQCPEMTGRHRGLPARQKARQLVLRIVPATYLRSEEQIDRLTRIICNALDDAGDEGYVQGSRRGEVIVDTMTAFLMGLLTDADTTLERCKNQLPDQLQGVRRQWAIIHLNHIALHLQRVKDILAEPEKEE